MMWIMEKVELKLRGHYAYYGVTDNYRGVARFHREVTKLYEWLNRRSQRRSYTRTRGRRGWAMETVENSAKNNCAEFSTVPTAPTTISFKKDGNRITRLG